MDETCLWTGEAADGACYHISACGCRVIEPDEHLLYLQHLARAGRKKWG